MAAMPTHAPADPPRTIVGWLATGALDAGLAALLWQLAEGGLPVTVAGPSGSGRQALVDAMMELRRAGVPLPPSRLPAVVEADSLAAVNARLAEPPFRAAEDELRTLGVVLILARATEARPRVVAAHYVRPVEQDGQGHVQRRPPAVLSTWDPSRGAFDDYAWGILPELAARVAVDPPTFAAERDRRATYLEALVAAGVTDPVDVRRAMAGYATTLAGGHQG
jgi:hypothetical protein